MVVFPRIFRHGLLMETGAAILFFGALAQQAELQHSASAALSELATQGYRLPSENDPLRIFPALTGGEFSGRHAGGWRPGSVYLRSRPQGEFGEAVYLRHELFHEVSHRSCGGRLPIWAEEAAAMHFSGELDGLDSATPPSENELQTLNRHIRAATELDGNDRAILARLAATADWPAQACAIPARLNALLGNAFDQTDSGAYLLMSVASGRILANGGDLHSPLPPGSLLKIPYAAALNQANPDVLATELANSDTAKLLQRREQFQADHYRLLLSPLQHSLPSQPATEQDWRAYLGERNAAGEFPLQTGLAELALTMRAALLTRPEYFRGLTQNGSAPGSTLAGQSEADKNTLRQLQALAKTGSVSTASGQPLAGHLLVAWPAQHPLYLALFRQRGVHGSALLAQAAPLLKRWQQSYPARFATVRVRLLTPTARDSWQAQADCPELAGPQSRFSVCGEFRIVSSARGSRSERLVNGIIYPSDNGPAVLETDADSYADAVLTAEAQTLTGSARQAMRAVIVWNGSHGNHRHGDTQSLCDTTHCMVFLGTLPTDKSRTDTRVDVELLQLLDTLATDSGLNWLPFANGGDQRWQRQIAGAELQTRFSEAHIDDIRRERRKDGELFIHLYYPSGEETLSCEIFRNTLKLPSCPDRIDAVVQHQAWQFQGLGAGHGLGLSLHRARALSAAGRNAEQILRDAYARGD